MKTDIEILELLLEQANLYKTTFHTFLMCRRLTYIIRTYYLNDWPIVEDRIFKELMKDVIQETYLNGTSTLWYPIEDINSRILNIERTIKRLKQ